MQRTEHKVPRFRRCECEPDRFKIAQMYSVIQSSIGQGMITLDQCLQDMVARNQISAMEARTYARQGEMFA